MIKRLLILLSLIKLVIIVMIIIDKKSSLTKPPVSHIRKIFAYTVVTIRANQKIVW